MTAAQQVAPRPLPPYSTGQLFDQWRLWEVRRKYWAARAAKNNTPAAEAMLRNIELELKRLYAEAESRAEQLPTEVLLYLIESCSGFSFNPKPTTPC